MLGLLTLALVAPAAQQVKSAEKKAEPRTLKVTLNYTGGGPVDSKHRIFLFVFDSPDFVQGNVMPLDSKPASAKDETVAFSGLTASPVYIVAAYDQAGDYDGQSGPPPSGSPMAMYSKTPGVPAPVKIEPGKTVQIDLSFDDSYKMP